MAIKGLSAVLANLEKEIKAIEAGAAKGLTKAGELIIKRAQDDVPYDTGDLSDSAYVDEPVTRASKIELELGFDKVYAAVQHDDLDFFHPVGKALYLEDVLINSEVAFNELIRSEAAVR